MFILFLLIKIFHVSIEKNQIYNLYTYVLNVPVHRGRTMIWREGASVGLGLAPEFAVYV